MNFKKSFIGNLSKVMSMVLILSMVLSMLAISSAESGDAASAEALEENDSSVSTSLDVSPKKLLKASDPEIAGSKFIEYIGKESFEAAGHVERITGLETLDTYVFGNADGTRTVYFMAEDVKYVDENGETVEKDITLTAKKDGYSIGKSDVSLFIPANPANGIDVEYGEYFVKLTPVSSVKNVSGTKNGNSVSYSSVFGEKAELKYTPILSGIKEDIVLSEYVSNASYSFTLETNGLYLYSSKNGYYLATDAYSDPIFYLGDIIVYDAAGKPDMGTMKVSTVKAGEKYTLTVSANDSFLSDPETVYPVTIDPTITIKDGSTANLIEDAPIFQNKPSTNFGAYTFNRVGMYNSDYGLSRTVVKLPGLTSSALYQAMSADDIIDVKFNVTETSGGSNYYVNIYPLTNTGWTESSVTWNNVGSYLSTAVSSGKLYADTVTSFDITDLVKSWKDGTRSASAGFIMVAANESSYRSFASSETADTTLRPSVVMTYQSHLNLSKYTLVLAEGENATINAITNPTYYDVFWRLLSDNGVVSISFTYSSCTVTGVSAGETILEASMRDEDNELHKIECRIYVHIPSGVYRIRNVGNGKYLDVTPSGTIAGSEVKQGTSNITDTSRNVLFKITYLDNIFNNNLSYYSIRPMTNSGLGIVTDSYNPGEDVVLDSISLYESDSNFSFNEMWAITHSGSSCTIKNGSASTSSYLATPNSSTSGAKVLISNTVTSNSKWVLEKYTGAKIEGISFTSSKTEVVVGDSFDYDACLYSSEIGVNSCDLTFSVKNTNGTATTCATVNSGSGALSTSVTGNIKVIATGELTNGQELTNELTVAVYKPAVLLIHGRTDNSFNVWGAVNSVYVNPLDTSEKGNNHFNSSLTATTIGTYALRYIDPTTQEIDEIFNGYYDNDVYCDEHPEGGNLAYYLDTHGYTPNVDLFVFNYPNEDAVVHNANKLDAYLSNLATYIRNYGTPQQKASFFGKTTGITSSTPYCIDIVGHSMGGLVARYYIENIGKDENIRKLITIDTPHWGSGLADYSEAGNVFGVHYLCDHDLMINSCMFGGSLSNALNCNAIGFNCYNNDYTLTNELIYNAQRSTKYYAIAGIDLPSSDLDLNDKGIDLNPQYETLSEISNTIKNAHSTFVDIDIYTEGDNTVEFLSQIGCVGSQSNGIEKRIDFEKMFVNIDTDGGNSVLNHFHSKMAHRTVVIEKVGEFLND